MTAGLAVTDPAGTPYQRGWLTNDQDFLSSPGGTDLADRGMTLARLRAPARLVDIGCGSGIAVEHLRRSLGLEAVGLDVAPVRGCRDISRLRAAGEDLPFANGAFDGALIQCTLSVVRDQEKVLAECSRVLVRGGKLVIADLYTRNPNAVDRIRKLSTACLSGMLTREELTSRLAALGFDIQFWEDHSNLLRDFLFRFAMEQGSVERLWERGEGHPEARDAVTALKDVRPGYCLVVAGKTER